MHSRPATYEAAVLLPELRPYGERSGRRELHPHLRAWKARTLLLCYVRMGCATGLAPAFTRFTARGSTVELRTHRADWIRTSDLVQHQAAHVVDPSKMAAGQARDKDQEEAILDEVGSRPMTIVLDNEYFHSLTDVSSMWPRIFQAISGAAFRPQARALTKLSYSP